MSKIMTSLFFAISHTLCTNGQYAQKQMIKIVNIVQNEIILLKFVRQNDIIRISKYFTIKRVNN